MCQVFDVPSLDDVSEEEQKKIWFSKADYYTFRSQAKSVAMELRRQGRHRYLEGAIGNEKPIGGNSTTVQTMLIQWSRCGFSARGIERWVHAGQGKLRKQMQKRAIRVVLEIQKQGRERNEPADETATKLCAVSELCTKEARTFSHKMGIADAAAILLQSHAATYLRQKSSGRLSTGGGTGEQRRRTQMLKNCTSPMA